ncbi:ferredoxin reductase family protein [Streptantibioticus silvisoli]|uniref:Ferredoxin reductase family protein n=1 Tax=Streptantibioticus silvisoli TaxID=2705255 RepID=A0ABT6VY29_9ACTN|nr:ferredoxin reductase family protein [Streptantibioticus silvisoli]MDI5963354.1 ferredoxin reductase family protein [Streptantibioticus silvisoli]
MAVPRSQNNPVTTRFPVRRRAVVLPPSVVRLVPVAAGVLVGAGAAGVLGLWWVDTSSVVGASGWFTGAGRICGLLAGYGCAVLLVLMARVPLLDRYAGTDRLARWHASGGRYVVVLASAHVLLIVWGYALSAHAGPVAQAWTLVWTYPDLLTGTAGFLLLLATGVVSARVARRRLRYETWHLLHAATYLAFFLVFGHQLSDGADFMAHRPVQLAWYALYFGAAAVLVRYRFVAPVRSALRHRLRVAEVRREGPGVVSVLVTGRRLDRLGALPGQFFRWRFLAPGLWWAANPYSLSAPPDGRSLRITVKASGGHSAALAAVAPGTRVWAEGPYGGLTADAARAAGTLLVAGGVGITPLRTLFETLPGDVVLVYRVRRAAELVLCAELDAIAARSDRAVHYAAGDAPDAVPLTARALVRLVPDLAARDVYLCGPPGMTDAARRAVLRAGVPRGRVHHESFTF